MYNSLVGMQQYESMPYCISSLSVLQYIAVLQYVTSLGKEHIMLLNLLLVVKAMYVRTYVRM